MKSSLESATRATNFTFQLVRIVNFGNIPTSTSFCSKTFFFDCLLFHRINLLNILGS